MSSTTNAKINKEYKPFKGCPYKPTKVCEKLKEYFYENGMKQVDIANALSSTQTVISNQLNGRPFGTSTALKWSDTFGFSIRWLLTGEGAMFDREHPTHILPADMIRFNSPKEFEIKIPVVPAWLFKAPDININEYITTHKDIQYLPPVPHFQKHELFAICPGNAMSPRICKGELMALQQLDKNNVIMAGDMFVIDTKSHGILVRKLFDNGKGYITCVPVNQDHFKQFDIPKEDIISVYTVVGCLNLNP